MKSISYNVDDRVMIFGFPENDELVNATGSILGTSSRTGPVEMMGSTAYIVLLDTPHSNGDKAITVVDSCIRPIEFGA